MIDINEINIKYIDSLVGLEFYEEQLLDFLEENQILESKKRPQHYTLYYSRNYPLTYVSKDDYKQIKQIDDFLKHFRKRYESKKYILKWINANLRRFLYKEGLISQEICENIIDYLMTLRGEKLKKISVLDAMKQSQLWLNRLLQEQTEEEGEIRVIFSQDNLNIVELKDPKAYAHESFMMRNCVRTYYERDELIYSLRDGKNSVATIAISLSNKGRLKTITEIKGPYNMAVSPQYVQFLIQWIQKENYHLDDVAARYIGLRPKSDPLSINCPLVRIKGASYYDVSQIKNIPKHIEGNLMLVGTQVKVLPKNLKVSGDVLLTNERNLTYGEYIEANNILISKQDLRGLKSLKAKVVKIESCCGKDIKVNAPLLEQRNCDIVGEFIGTTYHSINTNKKTLANFNFLNLYIQDEAMTFANKFFEKLIIQKSKVKVQNSSIKILSVYGSELNIENSTVEKVFDEESLSSFKNTRVSDSVSFHKSTVLSFPIVNNVESIYLDKTSCRQAKISNITCDTFYMKECNSFYINKIVGKKVQIDASESYINKIESDYFKASKNKVYINELTSKKACFTGECSFVPDSLKVDDLVYEGDNYIPLSQKYKVQYFHIRGETHTDLIHPLCVAHAVGKHVHYDYQNAGAMYKLIFWFRKIFPTN